jgi:hypothetical protein
MSGLLVIDAVGWRSMYFVVIPRVNLIVILSSYARYLYSINCPTIIRLPSLYYFILWRDTASKLWIPVLFPLLLSPVYFTRTVYFTRILLSLWDFYFRALGSLVVLSFPQPLSFSSVFPKPLSETLTRSLDGRNPL